MIYGVFGLPGSGKSYYVVREFILSRISSSVVVSNIKLSDNFNADNYIYLTKLDIDNLHNNIKKIILDESKSHDEKKLLLKSLFGLYNSHKGDLTLIVDEAHLYGYRGRSSSISWADDFLSIHRHIFEDNFFDVVLVTQVPSRLNKEIAGQIEVAIQAIPSSQRLIKSMLEYVLYGSVSALVAKDSTMRMKRLVLKADQSVFDVYQSGFVQEGSSDFRRKIGLIILGLIIVSAFTAHQFLGLVSRETYMDSNVSHLDYKILSSSDDKTLLSLNDINASFRYKIVCRVVPLTFDDHLIKSRLYTLYHQDDKEVCYKKYLKDNDV